MPDSIHNRCIRVAIGQDYTERHERIAQVLADKVSEGHRLEYQIENLDRHNWLDKIKSYDVVIWFPNYMGPESAGQFKEKIYFVENYLNKIVIPNFNTIWHFESKIAQSYVFSHYNIPTAKTVATFDYQDAIEQIKTATMPLVFKKSYGAGSKNVWLVKDRRQALQQISRTFCGQMWDDARKINSSKLRTILRSLTKSWFWRRVVRRIRDEESWGALYWQDFVPGNNADLRITVIGDRYAFAFWRNNRPQDFRASGSGLIDYERQVPEEIVRYCLHLNRKLNFDSMAYDILFSKEGFIINEMSYGFVDRAIHNSPGFYFLHADDTLTFKEGHYWPVELWVEWALHRAEKELT